MQDWILTRELKFRYMLLDRLIQECGYYIRIKGGVDCLWTGDEKKQIQAMIDIWNSFPDEDKPEWLTMEQIKDYARMMGVTMKGE